MEIYKSLKCRDRNRKSSVLVFNELGNPSSCVIHKSRISSLCQPTSPVDVDACNSPLCFFSISLPSHAPKPSVIPSIYSTHQSQRETFRIKISLFIKKILLLKFTVSKQTHCCQHQPYLANIYMHKTQKSPRFCDKDSEKFVEMVELEFLHLFSMGNVDC